MNEDIRKGASKAGSVENFDSLMQDYHEIGGTKEVSKYKRNDVLNEYTDKK